MISFVGARVLGSLLALTIGAWILPAPAPAVGSGSVPSVVDTETVEPGIWSWPLEPVPDVTRPFDLPHPYGAGHRGVDLNAATGAPVLAPDDGIVHFVGWVVDRPVLSIAHPNGLLSSFEPITALVAKGDAVARGQVIGHVAEDPAHSPSGGLHLGARDGDAYIDPLALLGAVPRAVLLPLGTP
ncbi:M23 family metallopeptidase [Gulosibacter molinativorax]|uniref:M23 family peptidase n=1 Tax=Gulosibacter molinativorax TaxID=256821 RepID=A0ABT7C9Y7_9MICO|nr:M23 family metallopeptidase [Gulosibacter molinativorax]MDJ1372005.1 M23 family peptidase [Gulosibacter molinativorax]QUY60752.1 Murein hydrolase activator NlpD [Gulosibacter molinativorax]